MYVVMMCVLEIRLVGCTEPNNLLTTDLSRLNPQTNIDHRQMERGLRSVQLGPVSVAVPKPLPATAQ